jgi:hypothetical protein
MEMLGRSLSFAPLSLHYVSPSKFRSSLSLSTTTHLDQSGGHNYRQTIAAEQRPRLDQHVFILGSGYLSHSANYCSVQEDPVTVFIDSEEEAFHVHPSAL